MSPYRILRVVAVLVLIAVCAGVITSCATGGDGGAGAGPITEPEALPEFTGEVAIGVVERFRDHFTAGQFDAAVDLLADDFVTGICGDRDMVIDAFEKVAADGVRPFDFELISARVVDEAMWQVAIEIRPPGAPETFSGGLAVGFAPEDNVWKLGEFYPLEATYYCSLPAERREDAERP